MFAAHHQLDNLVLIVDSNKKSMLGYCDSILNLLPLEEKFASFGWDAAAVERPRRPRRAGTVEPLQGFTPGTSQGARGQHGQGQGRAAARARRPLPRQNPERTRGPGSHGGSGMSGGEFKSMRDVFLERIHAAMQQRDDIFLVSDDFGSRVLDKIRADFGDRFINVGIAEQNCINVAAGLALEGFTVYAYGIACFMSMRSFEQIRVNVSMTSQLRPMNLNIVGVGAGMSYDVSGPSHHCLEDLTLLRLLPHVDLFSPSDWQTAARLADYSVAEGRSQVLPLRQQADAGDL